MHFLVLLLYKDGMTWEERAKALNQYLIVGIILVLLISFWLIRKQRTKERKKLERELRSRKLPKTKKAINYRCVKTSNLEVINNTAIPFIYKGLKYNTSQKAIVLYRDDDVIGICNYEQHKKSGALLQSIQLVEEQKVEVFLKQVFKHLIEDDIVYLAVYVNKSQLAEELYAPLGFRQVTLGKKEQQEMPGVDFWKLKL